MAFSLADALVDPLLSAADPHVVSAGDHLDERPVRWAHASEQLDVAPFLLGGELVLMEGVQLGGEVAPEDLVAYVESLVEADVAALAVELGGRLTRVPAPLLGRARECGLAVIELHRRVPFVQICKSINTRVTEQSLRQKQASDEMSSSLMNAVAAGAGVPELLRSIADGTGALPVLYRLDGRLVLPAPGGPVDRLAGPPAARGPAGGARAAFSVPLEAAGSPLGTLVLHADVDADVDSIAMVLDRTPQILSVTMLRSAPPSSAERLTGRLLARLTRPSDPLGPGDPELGPLLGEAGLLVPDAGPRGTAPGAADGAFLTVRLDLGPHPDLVASARDALAAAAPRHVLQFHGETLVAIAGFDGRADLDAARSRLAVSLGAIVRRGATGCLGAGTVGIAGLPHEHGTAIGYRRWADLRPGVLGDARELHLRRLAVALEGHDEVEAFLDSVLGGLRDSPQLMATLGTYAALWGNKTEAARRLGIGRQALYDRLARIEALIGPLEGSAAHNAATIVAALLAVREPVAAPRRGRRRG